MNLVELDSIRHCYGKLEVLHDLNLTLAPGEVLGLFGHNGAGKTTSMKLVLGLLQPTEGRVQVFGQSPGDTKTRTRLGYLPENVSFYPQLTGYETLRHFAQLKNAPRTQIEALLEQVGLAEARHRKVKTYSKGMRQRLGLAQALLGHPELLLLDEPTVGLDPIATAELYALIQRLRARGTAVILCSHLLAGVEAFIDRAAIMGNGTLQAIGTLSELRSAAGLASTIRIKGLSRVDTWHHRLLQEGFESRVSGMGMLEVSAHNSHKFKVLRLLLDQGDAEDIEIHPASMEEIYRHVIHETTGPHHGNVL